MVQAEEAGRIILVYVLYMNVPAKTMRDDDSWRKMFGEMATRVTIG